MVVTETPSGIDGGKAPRPQVLKAAGVRRAGFTFSGVQPARGISILVAAARAEFKNASKPSAWPAASLPAATRSLPGHTAPSHPSVCQ